MTPTTDSSPMTPKRRRSGIPIEFLLLPMILQTFRNREQNGWIACTRSEITRKFLYRRARGYLSPRRFLLQVLPGWINRGLAREVKRPGRTSTYEFRRPTSSDVSARLNEITRAWKALHLQFHRRSEPGYQSPEIQMALNRLELERSALRIEQYARLDDTLTQNQAP